MAKITWRKIITTILFSTAISWMLQPGAHASDAFEFTVEIPGSEIAVIIDSPRKFQLSTDEIQHWIQSSITTVEDYYGRFPVDSAFISIQPEPGKGVLRGTAFGFGSAAVNIQLGTKSTQDDLQKDWILVHELVHLAFPRVPAKHEWIEEGLATYIEAIASTQSKRRSPENLWQYFYENMPHGLPQHDDLGLDNTRTWGRIYWGGALFCFLADIEIRQRTQGKKGLKDGLIALLDNGFNHLDEKNSLVELLEIADNATGTTVLTELYVQHATKPTPVNLAALWEKLGVEHSPSSGIKYNNQSEWTALRKKLGEG